MAGVRVYFKRKIVLDRLNFQQQDMLKLLTVGLGSFLQRVRLGRDTNDAPTKPLQQGYARFKLRHGLIPRRDLYGVGGRTFLKADNKRRKKGKFSSPGHMLDNLSVRTVTNDSGKIGYSTEWARLKARANELRQAFMAWSPKDRANISEGWRRIFQEKKARLAKIVSITTRAA